MRTELRSREFCQKNLRLMAPIILQQVINFGINFLDNVMVGGFGETQIAAISFGNQFYALFQFICMGLGSGAVVLSSQFWGRRELDPLRTVAAIAMRLTVALGLVFSLVCVAWPAAMMRIFTDETAVIAAGTDYMRLLGLTYLLAGISSTTTYLLRSVGHITVPFIGSAGAFLLNLFFNWVFIFGKLGAPRMEVVGAAVGTIIARVFEFCFIFGYFILKDERFRFRWRDIALPGGWLRKQYFKFGLPVLISDSLLGLSLLLIGIITGHMGEEMSAASAMVNSVIQIVNILNMSMSSAAAIVIGNTIGEGNIPRAKREANAYMVLSFAYGFLMIAILLLLEQPYVALYDVSQATVRMAHGMMLCNCVWLPIQVNAYMTSKGILRGGGDTRFLMYADSSTIWFVSLPLGALAGFVWNMDPIWVYFFLRIEYPLKGLVCLIRYCTGKWIKVIAAKEQ